MDVAGWLWSRCWAANQGKRPQAHTGAEINAARRAPTCGPSAAPDQVVALGIDARRGETRNEARRGARKPDPASRGTPAFEPSWPAAGTKKGYSDSAVGFRLRDAAVREEQPSNPMGTERPGTASRSPTIATIRMAILHHIPDSPSEGNNTHVRHEVARIDGLPVFPTQSKQVDRATTQSIDKENEKRFLYYFL